MDKNYKNQEKRIELVFPETYKDISRRMETIAIYREYLEKNLKFPVKLTGIEDFDWEEFYVMGPGDVNEYNELKKTNPSFTDIYNLNQIGKADEYYGILAALTRVSDKKRFTLPLADLTAIDQRTKNYQLIDDYAVWFWNY